MVIRRRLRAASCLLPLQTSPEGTCAHLSKRVLFSATLFPLQLPKPPKGMCAHPEKETIFGTALFSLLLQKSPEGAYAHLGKRSLFFGNAFSATAVGIARRRMCASLKKKPFCAQRSFRAPCRNRPNAQVRISETEPFFRECSSRYR